MPRLVVAFDKFRGTATGRELLAAGLRAAAGAGWQGQGTVMADGGEGSLDVLGGPNKTTTVTAPNGDPVEAEWRLSGRVAYIEMAAASGLTLVGGKEENDALAADTLGTGELISTAIELGARTVNVFLGGSATTDGGFGAIRALPPKARLKEIDLVVACDVETAFTDAAQVFAPQKGATPAQTALLTRRLERLVQIYLDTYGVDVSEITGAGAAGGLAGGLFAMGGRSESGFDILAEHVGLDEMLRGVDLVVTGEGHLDATSFQGKVIGGVARWASDEGVPVLAVVGSMADDLALPSEGFEVVVLADRFGLDAAMSDPTALVEQVIVERLGAN